MVKKVEELRRRLQRGEPPMIVGDGQPHKFLWAIPIAFAARFTFRDLLVVVRRGERMSGVPVGALWSAGPDRDGHYIIRADWR